VEAGPGAAAGRDELIGDELFDTPEDLELPALVRFAQPGLRPLAPWLRSEVQRKEAREREEQHGRGHRRQSALFGRGRGQLARAFDGFDKTRRGRLASPERTHEAIDESRRSGVAAAVPCERPGQLRHVLVERA
jgi:hypothetical protein